MMKSALAAISAAVLSGTLTFTAGSVNAAEFLLLPGSSTLAILGELEISDVAEFVEHLDRGVEEVILSSDGGNLAAAWEIGALIAAHGIRTRLTDETDCASACAILFLHGPERSMESSARLGVHLPFFSESGTSRELICQSLEQELGRRLNPSLYDYHDPNWPGTFNVAHILVRSRAEAERILQQLADGRQFSELAREFSLERTSASLGGTLLPFSNGTMVPPFEQAVRELEVGEISQPVQTRFGWHVILLNGVRGSTSGGSGVGAVQCLTLAYQVGALEFLRLSDLLRQADVSEDFLRLVVETPSDAIRWVTAGEAVEFGVIAE